MIVVLFIAAAAVAIAAAVIRHTRIQRVKDEREAESWQSLPRPKSWADLQRERQGDSEGRP